jgi:DNA repair protein RAD57
MNPILSALPFEAKPSLDKILSIQTPDLESQDHILRYQVPVAVKRHNIGLVVIDSIASNYRAEFERPAAAALTPHNSQRAQLPDRRAGQAMAERRSHLVQLGAHLRNLALTENIVIIVSNQVADRFSPISVSPSHPPHAAPQASGEQMAPEAATITPDPLTLDHQQRWFTGWGDQTPFTPGHTSLKTPSLGLVWINQIAARVTLIKDSQGENLSRRRRRWMRVVFAPWTASTSGLGVEFEITGAGIKAVAEADKNV